MLWTFCIIILVVLSPSLSEILRPKCPIERPPPSEEAKEKWKKIMQELISTNATEQSAYGYGGCQGLAWKAAREDFIAEKNELPKPVHEYDFSKNYDYQKELERCRRRG